MINTIVIYILGPFSYFFSNPFQRNTFAFSFMLCSFCPDNIKQMQGGMGVGAADALPPQESDSLPTQIFLKATLAPEYTYLRGSAPKKRNFFKQNSKKCLKTLF